MFLKRINSSVMSAVGYDPSSMLMEVKFKTSGRIYAYMKVPLELYRKFTKAKSKGEFFNKFIKEKHDFFLVR